MEETNESKGKLLESLLGLDSEYCYILISLSFGNISGTLGLRVVWCEVAGGTLSSASFQAEETLKSCAKPSSIEFCLFPLEMLLGISRCSYLTWRTCSVLLRELLWRELCSCDRANQAEHSLLHHTDHSLRKSDSAVQKHKFLGECSHAMPVT